MTSLGSRPNPEDGRSAADAASGLRPDGLSRDASQAEPLVPNASFYQTNAGPLPKPRWSNPSLLTDEFAAYQQEAERD